MPSNPHTDFTESLDAWVLLEEDLSEQIDTCAVLSSSKPAMSLVCFGCQTLVPADALLDQDDFTICTECLR
jgi:hypothetical protein